MALAFTSIEKRVLAYLDQRGPTRREEVVIDLASEDSLIAARRKYSKSGRGFVRGSNGATPLIMGKWCKRLEAEGLVRNVRDRDCHYRHHEITPAGRAALRASS